MSASEKKILLSLYKLLLRESAKFPSYNFREYGKRRIRDGFRQSGSLQEAQDALAMLKRQATIASLYKTNPLVIENKQ